MSKRGKVLNEKELEELILNWSEDESSKNDSSLEEESEYEKSEGESDGNANYYYYYSRLKNLRKS